VLEGLTDAANAVAGSPKRKRCNLAPGAPLFLTASNEVDDSGHRPRPS
jgi:hypothetical protein